MSANPVVDPAQLERLRDVPGCGSKHQGSILWPTGYTTWCHEVALRWCDTCSDCLTLLAAAVEEQTIERCAADIASIPELWSDDPLYALARREAVSMLRSLPRQWGSTPEEAR